MPFWYAAFWGFVWTALIFFIVLTPVSIFKLNLNIPFSAFLISIPVVWVASTVFIFFFLHQTGLCVSVLSYGVHWFFYHYLHI